MKVTTVCPTPLCGDVHTTRATGRVGDAYTIVETCPDCIDRGERHVTQADVK